jgi:hypothetical protein
MVLVFVLGPSMQRRLRVPIDLLVAEQELIIAECHAALVMQFTGRTPSFA